MDYATEMDSVLVKSNKVEDKTKKNRRLQNEYLLNNIIDKDFQAMLYPLTLVPFFFLMSQFSIINNFITPENGVFYFLKYFSGCIIFLLTNFFRFQWDIEFVEDISSDVINFLFTLGFISFSVISIFAYIVNFAQRCNTVELIIRLQDVLNCIKIDKLNFLAKQKKRNWFSVLMVVSVYVLQGTLASESFVFLQWLMNFLVISPLLICDIQVVVVSCIVEMIKDELLAWKKKMEEYAKTYVTSGEVNTEVVSESDMFRAYVNIIEAFGLCCKVYTFSVTFYIFQTLLNILIALEFGLELEKNVSEDLTFSENTFKNYYYPDNKDESSDEEGTAGFKIKQALAKKRPGNDIDSFFERPKKQCKVVKRSSNVSKSSPDGIANLSSGTDDGAYASHLIKIEIYDVQKIKNIPPTEHWKNADVRLKYFALEDDSELQSTRNIIYNITKQLASKDTCVKYFIDNKKQ